MDFDDNTGLSYENFQEFAVGGLINF
jgi:hypothetical protein